VTDPGDRVPVQDVQARVGPALLQHHQPVTLPVPAEIDAAAVGELDDALDRVRQLRRRHRVASGQMRLQETRQGRPLGRRKDRPAIVRDEATVGPLDRQHPLPGIGQAMTLRESPIADEQRSVAVTQVGQDIGALDPGERVIEFLQDQLELRLVGGIDRHQLSAGLPIGRFGVVHDHDGFTAEKLERHSARDAVVPDLGQRAIDVVQPGGDVDLPTLVGRLDPLGCVAHPDVGRLVIPPFRHRARDQPDFRSPRFSIRRRIVKESVGQAIKRIFIHANPAPKVHPSRRAVPHASTGRTVGVVP
jgi:hypothetical protein